MFAPALTAEQLGAHNALVIGLVFSAYMAPSVLGAPIGGRFSPATAQRIGMSIFLAGLAGIITSLSSGSLDLFLAASVTAGAGQGIAVSASIRGLLHASTVTDRSPLFAAIYVLSYSGAAIPSLVSGRMSDTFTLIQIAAGYGILGLLAVTTTILAARNPREDTPPKDSPPAIDARTPTTTP